jgi:hypothetical protein
MEAGGRVPILVLARALAHRLIPALALIALLWALVGHILRTSL